jgi:hypothetical protein
MAPGRLTASILLVALLAGAGCAWPWDSLEPQLDTAPIDAAFDAGPCGNRGEPCCASAPRCSIGLGCFNERCQECPTGLTECSSECVDLRTDRNNCGTRSGAVSSTRATRVWGWVTQAWIRSAIAAASTVYESTTW